MRLVVGLGALEAGQEAVVDVDRASSQGLAQPRRKDLHVTRQHHQVDALALDQVDNRLLLAVAVGRVHRQVLERHAVGPGQRGEVGMVGDHRGDVHRQLAAVGAEQQIVETMPLPADQHQQACTTAGVMQLPVHVEPAGQLAEALAHPRQRGRGRQLEVHAQEEAPALLVAVLLGVEDVAALVEQQAGDAVDDAGAIRAGQGEDVVVAHRCVMLCESPAPAQPLQPIRTPPIRRRRPPAPPAPVRSRLRS